MELEFLGTSAGSPSKFRNVTSTALKLLDEINEIWLFDVGEGTQHQILRTTIRPRKVSKIFITHLHGDHLFGLPGFLSSRSFQGAEQTPLTIYGPVGIKEFVETTMHISQTHLSYPIKYVELGKEETIFESKRFKVSFKNLDHRIQSIGYRIEEKDYPGELMVNKLKELDIQPGPIYGKIKAGETVTLDNGQVINGKDFIGKSKKGRIVTILGDTRNNPNIVKLAENANVLVHESTFGKVEAKLARNYYHSTCVQAAENAKKAHVQELLLTHISARYIGPLIKKLENDARQIFPHTKVVRDFEIYKVPFRKEGR